MPVSQQRTVLRVRLTPRGAADALVRREQECVIARVSAPPVDGAANRALIELMARTLRIAKSKIKIVAGETRRNKTLQIDGMSADEVRLTLDAALPADAL